MPPRTRLARLGIALLGLAMAVGLGGCSSWDVPGSQALFIYVQHEAANNKTANRLGEEDLTLQNLLQELIDRYRRKNPRVRIHVRSFAADDLAPEIRLRQNSGLGPDLVISDVDVAFELHDQKLTNPVRISSERLHNIAPQIIEPFQQNGALLALPLSLQPQIACFNRGRIPKPPQSLQQVLELAAKGHKVGLPITITDLVWTASGLAPSVLPSLLATIQADRIPGVQEPVARAALTAWLDWIRMASLQQYVVFADSNEELYAQLESGELDWIPCRSLQAKWLQTKLGGQLGASPLPGRDPSQPAAVTVKLSAWSFGHHSSDMQQQLAKDFALFSLNEINQKELMLQTQSALPVNTQVMVPSKSSQLLAAMQIGLEHGLLLDFRRRMLMLNNNTGKLQSLVRQAVLGESGANTFKPTPARP